jgi:hypothetical protein
MCLIFHNSQVQVQYLSKKVKFVVQPKLSPSTETYEFMFSHVCVLLLSLVSIKWACENMN